MLIKKLQSRWFCVFEIAIALRPCLLYSGEEILQSYVASHADDKEAATGDAACKACLLLRRRSFCPSRSSTRSSRSTIWLLRPGAEDLLGSAVSSKLFEDRGSGKAPAEQPASPAGAQEDRHAPVRA